MELDFDGGGFDARCECGVEAEAAVGYRHIFGARYVT